MPDVFDIPVSPPPPADLSSVGSDLDAESADGATTPPPSPTPPTSPAPSSPSPESPVASPESPSPSAAPSPPLTSAPPHPCTLASASSLPVLSPEDRATLSRFITLKQNLSALALESGKDIIDLLTWVTGPHISPCIAALRDLDNERRRNFALDLLEDLCKESQDPVEKRRAAAVILRTLPDAHRSPALALAPPHPRAAASSSAVAQSHSRSAAPPLTSRPPAPTNKVAAANAQDPDSDPDPMADPEADPEIDEFIDDEPSADEPLCNADFASPDSLLAAIGKAFNFDERPTPLRGLRALWRACAHTSRICGNPLPALAYESREAFVNYIQTQPRASGASALARPKAIFIHEPEETDFPNEAHAKPEDKSRRLRLDVLTRSDTSVRVALIARRLPEDPSKSFISTVHTRPLSDNSG